MMLPARCRAARISTSPRLHGGVRMKSDLVTLEKVGRVGVLRLNDPKRLNPMTGDMGKALEGTKAVEFRDG